MQCAQCKTENRSNAKFCKACGKAIEASTPAVSLGVSIDELVGLDDLKKELQQLQAILEGMKQQGSTSRYPYNTILIGASGTAKTLVSNLISDLFLKFGIITKSKPHTIDGEALEKMQDDNKGLQKLFEDAKGNILFVDNAQKLVDGEGNASAGFQRFINKMDQYKDDPIVLMAGLPFGLREFAKNPKNKNITGRFQKIFTVSDYTPAQYAAIVEFNLKKQGFTFSSEASEKLLKRFRFLYKELKKADSGINAVNGYLAVNEGQSITGSYFSRKGSDKTILPEDIKGQVEEKKSLQEVMSELDSIIGMTGLKKEIKSLYTQLNQIAEMEKKGIKTDKPAQHFVITGNPGTGKTTVARLLGKIFEGLGLLEAGHVVEVDRSKLVAGFVGQTAPLTNQACDSAMGGILFIDEAYSLKQNDSDSFGQECIDTLLKRMEDDRGKFMVIAAGYKTPIEKFLASNEGLKSRFTKNFFLEDYNPEELAAIFASLADKQHCIVPPETSERIIAFFKDRVARKTKDFANGREARNLMDEARRNQAERLSTADFSTMSKDDALTFLPQDIPATASEKAVSVDDALKDLNELTGLSSVKEAVVKIANTIKGQKRRGETTPVEKHFVFQGNPGTGKTTVARIMGDVFKSLGMLGTNNLIEVDRSKLVAQHVGGTAPLINTACDNAMGGILFIDEAYDLVRGPSDQFGYEAVGALLKRMEDDRGKFVVIAAGYTKEMNEFLEANSGFRSRFSDYIDFEDYKVDEMTEIFTKMCKKGKFEFGPGFDEALKSRLTDMYSARTKNFANAREVRQLFLKTKENLDTRINQLEDSGTPQEEINRLQYILQPQDVQGKVEEKKSIEDIMAELDSIIGMTTLKKEVKSLYTQLKHITEMEKKGLAQEKPAHHFVITGNPGTGKTTVARLLGKIFEGLGLLRNSKVVEVDRSKLVAEYVGQTGPLTNKACDSAMGGILFIDEAYSLNKGDNDQFGNECIETLLKRMEDDRGKYMVIVAGYKERMEKFLTANDGLKSRFTKYFNLEDYNPDELTAIFAALAGKQQFIVPPETKERIMAFFKDRCARKTKDFANGREARNLMDEARRNQAERLSTADIASMSKEDALTILPQDIPTISSEKAVSIEEALKDLNQLTGLNSVKEAVAKIANTLKAQKITGQTETLSKHFVFMGNPGTGKTTVARIMGDVFKAVGLLPTNNVVEVDRSKLVGQYTGHTPPMVNSACDNAMGGILFIDEAYDLVKGPQDQFGNEAVTTLLKRIEDDRGKFICIAAGYTKEMDEFLATNSGFKSRFTDYISFEDYNVAEMRNIFIGMSKKSKKEFAPGFDDALQKRLEDLYNNRNSQFANARTVRQLFEKTKENLDSRILNSGLPADDMKREILIMRPEDLDMTVS